MVRNIIHEGEDNCTDYIVRKEQLEKLKADCVAVLADHSLAPTLLPTSDGFFFGSTEYNEFYFEDLEETIKIIDKALAETDFDKEEVFYYAWY